MSQTNPADELNTSESSPSAHAFKEYSDAERARRLNSGDEFDQQTYDETVSMVLRKLALLANEGWS